MNEQAMQAERDVYDGLGLKGVNEDKPRGQVNRTLMDVTDAVQDVRKNFDMLAERLHVVLRPEGPEKGADSVDPRMAGSPLADELSSVLLSLRSLSFRVCETMARVDL